MASKPQQTILVLHTSTVDPYPFIQRLIELPGPIEDDPVEIPWRLDNKYYTANVTLQVLEVGQDDPVQAKDFPVMIYLFQGGLDSVPATLVKLLMAEPRDVALAIRIASISTAEEDGLEGHGPSLETSWEAIEEIFEEVGMEAIDEAHHIVEDDDERPISPLDQIRQTLMTHMWPEMERKPLGRAVPLDLDTMDEGPDEAGLYTSYQHENAGDGTSPTLPARSTFPVNFYSPAGPSRITQYPSSLHPAAAQGGAEEGSKPVSFPALDELRAQIQFEDHERFERGDMNRLDAMDDDLWKMLDGGPGMEEYARLDEWLDGDGEGPGTAPEEPEDTNEVGDPAQPNSRQNLPEKNTQTQKCDDPGPSGSNLDGFDDDFDDFAPFQSAPRANTDSTFESLDPTPLLLHLQNIRTELAGVTDEDERRVRAGKEVARLMREVLGMGGDFGLDELEDIRELDDPVDSR